MIQEILYIAIFQFDLIWENPVANRLKIDGFLRQSGEKTDLVVLPEMFTTGFSMNVESLAERMDGETIQWMKKRSQEYQLALCGSIIIRENGEYFNRLLFTEPSGEVHFYDKRHLFTMGNEETQFRKGSERIVVTYKGWRICPLICYDLRFPVWARNRNEYDLLIYSADWPMSRNEVWNTLLKARAIENQTYVVGANRVGVDGNSIAYKGNSQVISPKGIFVSGPSDGVEKIVTAEISYPELIRFRTEFPVLNDADDFNLIKD